MQRCVTPMRGKEVGWMPHDVQGRGNILCQTKERERPSFGGEGVGSIRTKGLGRKSEVSAALRGRKDVPLNGEGVEDILQ